MTATETTRPEGSPGAWLDEGEISPAWAPPAGNPLSQAPVPGSLVYGGVVLGLVLLIAAVWSAGGFHRRTDLLRPVEPGAVISTGPFEFTFTEATAQQHLDTNGVVTWEIMAIGQARTTGNETIAPDYSDTDTMFAIRDTATTMSANPQAAAIGEPNELGASPQRFLTPGLPPTPYRLTFDLPATYRPQRSVRLAVIDLVYGSHYLTSNEKDWSNGTYGHVVDLPLRVLPPKND